MKVRKLLALMMALALLLSLTACGGSANDSAASMEYKTEAPQEMGNGGLYGDASTGTPAALPENRKLIKTVQIDAETDDLDPLLTNVEEKVTELGGYVEGREVYNGSTYAQRRYRHADLTIRIPADQLNGFVEHVEGVSNVVSSNETIDDVTLTYVDTESRVKALETERDRLLELMEQAETMSDLLEIEGRLTEVRYQLDSVTSQLKTLENQVSYATVHLYISEVQEYTPVEEETVWQRIAGSFIDSLEDIGDGAVELLIWVLGRSPYLVLFGGIGAAALLLLRKRKKKVRKAPREEKSE